MNAVTAGTIETPTHGRYLVRAPDDEGTLRVLIGFHGYKENADIQMERLLAIPGAERWTLVSIQGLHRFYASRSSRVIASWMTSQDRELAIVDNLAYVSGVIAAVSRGAKPHALVYSGFSQGVAMALRAACRLSYPSAAAVMFGGDVPPELPRDDLARVPRVLLGRGERDEWYTDAIRTADLARLADAAVAVEAPVLDSGHEWTAAFSERVGALLSEVAG